MKNLEILKWSSTGLLIGGSILSSLNLYPFNIIASLTGNIGWMIAGIVMADTSLWFVSAFLTIVYVAGIVGFCISHH